MNKREVLEKLVEGKYNYTDPRVKKDKMDIALTALDKLEKEKMLEMVGEEKNASNRSRDVMHHTDGYNQAIDLCHPILAKQILKVKGLEKSISDVLTQRDMWKTDYAELQAENKKLKEQQLTVDTIEKVFDKHTIIANSDILYRKDLAIAIIKAREDKQHRTCDPECPFYKTEEASK